MAEEIGFADAGPVWLILANMAVVRHNGRDVADSTAGGVFVPGSLEAFGYVPDGNLAFDGQSTYAWDAENRLIRMVANTTVGPQQSIRFEYDAQGRRIGKRGAGTPTGPYPGPGTPPGGVGKPVQGLLGIMNACSRMLDKMIVQQAIDRAMAECKAQTASRTSGKKCCAITWCYQCGCNTGTLNKLDRLALGLIDMSCDDLRSKGTIGPGCPDKNDKALDTYDDMQKP